MKRLAVLGLPLLLCVCLSACCPPAVQGTATAFRASVLGSTPETSVLHVQQGPDAPLLSVVTAAARLEEADGSLLELSALRPGDSVYLTGTVTASGITATNVQRLE